MIVGPQFIWLHFPKCAGTTVASALHLLAADRADVHCDAVFATGDLSQVKWHQNVRERRNWDATFKSEGKEIVANFRRLPYWMLSKIHFASRLVPHLVPTRQMLTAGRYYEDDGTVMSADECLAYYTEEPVSYWIRVENLADDFNNAFARHFDLSAEGHRNSLGERKNADDTYIKSLDYNFTAKEIDRLYLMNPTWAALEAKLYGDVVRLPTVSLPPARAAEVTTHSIVAIIPLYNGAPYIEEAIRSVLAQTVKPDEFLIVDDGSTDEGPEIVKRFGQAHLTLLRQENAGQSAARNFGVRHSTSSLIAFLDQDDSWYPHHLEELLKPFKEDYRIPIGWSYSNLDEIDDQGRFVNSSVLDMIHVTHPKRSLIKCLGEDMFILPSASLISREAFDTVGGFDERLSGYEDDDLFLRIFRSGYDNVYLNKSLSRWRIYQYSSSFSKRMRHSRMIYFKKLCEEYKDNKSRNLFFARDVIAPRFIRNILSEYNRSVSEGARDRILLASDDLWVVSKYLRGRRRLAMIAFSLVARNTTIGLVSKSVYYLLRRAGVAPF